MDMEKMNKFLEMREKGFSTSQIAAAFGLATGTVSSAFYRYAHRPHTVEIKRFPGQQVDKYLKEHGHLPEEDKHD